MPQREWSRLSRDVLRFKDGQGGKFYVTEAGWVWAPYKAGTGTYDWAYAYIGVLWDLVSGWYPKTE